MVGECVESWDGGVREGVRNRRSLHVEVELVSLML